MKNILLFLLFCTASLSAQIKEPLVYLTWQNDPTTTMTIQWLTMSASRDDVVHYSEKNSTIWQTTSGVHKKLPQKERYHLHRVELRDLQPNSMYHFRLGASEKAYSFRTMPQDLSQPVRFVMGGDAYSTSVKRFRLMTQQAARVNPHFAIIGGDIAYAAVDGKKKESFTKWANFFSYWMQDMRDGDGCLIPLFVTVGNHEVVGRFHQSPKQAKLYYALFGKAIYDFGFGNYAHFTFLDTSHTHPVKGKQTRWLKKTLKSHNQYTHRFAVYHVGAYPSTRKYDDKIPKAIRKKWVPLFEKYKINACFESHDHAYKRTHPLRNGKKHPKGVVYLGDGSWGAVPRKVKKKSYLANAKGCQQVLVVELKKDKRSFYALNPFGKVIDSYEQMLPITVPINEAMQMQ